MKNKPLISPARKHHEKKSYNQFFMITETQRPFFKKKNTEQINIEKNEWFFFRFCFSLKFCNCAEFTRRINFWLGSAKQKSPICYPLATISILCSSVPRGAGWGDRHPSILVVNCFQRVPFGITLWHPFFAQQPQTFSKGVFGANIKKFW